MATGFLLPQCVRNLYPTLGKCWVEALGKVHHVSMSGGANEDTNTIGLFGAYCGSWENNNPRRRASRTAASRPDIPSRAYAAR